MSEKRTPNDQRSDVYNPTSGDHQDMLDNRSNQLNPNHVEYKGDSMPKK